MRKMVVAIVAAVVLAGCAQNLEPGESASVLEDTAPQIVLDFDLPDGTRCIFAKSGYGGGLSCDF